MTEPDCEEASRPIADLLEAVERGDEGAFDKLVTKIYPELKALAHFRLSRERKPHTLCTTAIVHEAFVRMSSGSRRWVDKPHFLKAASTVMRHLLVDYARSNGASKRGGGMVNLTLNDEQHGSDGDSAAILALDSAIKEIGEIDPRLEKLIEYRYFAGLSVTETAQILGVSERTIQREWRRARGYLKAIV